jgi:hypothetical protein
MSDVYFKFKGSMDLIFFRLSPITIPFCYMMHQPILLVFKDCAPSEGPWRQIHEATDFLTQIFVEDLHNRCTEHIASLPIRLDYLSLGPHLPSDQNLPMREGVVRHVVVLFLSWYGQKNNCWAGSMTIRDQGKDGRIYLMFCEHGENTKEL